MKIALYVSMQMRYEWMWATEEELRSGIRLLYEEIDVLVNCFT